MTGAQESNTPKVQMTTTVSPTLDRLNECLAAEQKLLRCLAYVIPLCMHANNWD